MNTMNSTLAVRCRRGQFAVMTTFLAIIAVALLMNSLHLTQLAVTETRQRSNSELIDSLVDLNYFSIGFEPWQQERGAFLGAEFSRQLNQDEPQESREPPAQLVELVKRGSAALPKLLDHFNDNRRTNIVVGTHRSFDVLQEDFPDRIWRAGAIYIRNEYDARHGSRRTVLERVTERVNEYWVTVGDVCYVAVGQIVNREFELMEYGGENCAMIMSPSLRPDLLRIVKAEWGQLTASDHRNSLIQDTKKSHGWFGKQRTVGAVKRLCFYYPRLAEDVLQSLLSRKVYNENSAIDFVEQIEKSDPGDARQLFEQYVISFGEPEAIGCVEIISEKLAELRDDIAEFEAEIGFGASITVNGVAFNRNHEWYEQSERLSRLLDKLLPLIGGPSALDKIASIEEQILLLDATVGFASKKVDDLLPFLVEQAFEIHTGHSRELIAACERRIAKQDSLHDQSDSDPDARNQPGHVGLRR